MKSKSVAGAIVIVASVILLSSLRIWDALTNIAAATMGFLGTSELTASTIFLYVLGGILLVGGVMLIISDLVADAKRK